MLRENLEDLKNRLANYASTHAVQHQPPAAAKNEGVAGTYLDPRFNRNTGGWPPGAVPDYKVRPFLYEIPDQNFKRYSNNNSQTTLIENFLRSSHDLLHRFKNTEKKKKNSSNGTGKGGGDTKRLKELLEAHVVNRRRSLQNEKTSALTKYASDFVLFLATLGISFDLGKQIQKYMELNYGGYFYQTNIDQAGNFLAQLESILPLFIHSSGPICLKTNGLEIVTLLGPSGAGKTTALLKLALQYRHQLKKNVAVLSWVTQGSSHEYGKNQTELLQIPFTSIVTQNDFLKALEEHKDRDLLLIDTFSPSLHKLEQKEALQQSLVHTYAGSRLLVLPAYTNSLDVKQTIDLYQPLQIDSLVITKLDESASQSILINSFYELGTPISYLSEGPDITAELRVADPEEIAKKWVGLHKDALTNLLKNHT